VQGFGDPVWIDSLANALEVAGCKRRQIGERVAQALWLSKHRRILIPSAALASSCSLALRNLRSFDQLRAT
jgi:hypothetical protein